MVLLNAIKQKGHLGKSASKMPGIHDEYFTLAGDLVSSAHGMHSLSNSPLYMALRNIDYQ
jgi:hypothetical protein